MSTEFAVIGLGVFGRNVALDLARRGQSVLAIDTSSEEVQAAARDLDAVICADATDERALRELQIERVTCAVVAIGPASMQASILATALLRQLGVPRIVARALDDLHARVLRAVGAHEVVSPEAEMGQRLARRLAEPNVLEAIDLGLSASLAEVEAPESFVGKTLIEVDVRRRFGVSVLALRRADGGIDATISGDEVMTSGAVLIVIGTPEAIGRLAAVV